MDKSHDKLMKDVQRLLESQNFESEEELRKFMDGMVNKEIPSMPARKLNNKEKAVDLVFEAYELSHMKAKAKIEEALKLDPDCIDAYEYLGTNETNVVIKEEYFRKGISIGKRIFGSEYLEEHKGKFWGFIETRPFMRCMESYSICLYNKGKVNESAAILEEMIELNPNDNQGVRDQLFLYLLELGEDKKFLRYDRIYRHDDCAFQSYNRALFAFKTEGDSKNSMKLIAKAMKQNKHIPGLLLSDKRVSGFGDGYISGDKSEADYYVYFAYHVWRKVEGAIDWLWSQYA